MLNDMKWVRAKAVNAAAMSGQGVILCCGCLSDAGSSSKPLNTTLRNQLTSTITLKDAAKGNLDKLHMCLVCRSLLWKFVRFKEICSRNASILLSAGLSDLNIGLCKFNSLTHCKTVHIDINANEPNAAQIEVFTHKDDTRSVVKLENGIEHANIQTEEIEVEFDENYYESDESTDKSKTVGRKVSVKNQVKRLKDLDTPAKRFDFSMVIVTKLSRDDQIKELKESREAEEYVMSPYKCEKCAKGFAHEIVYKEHCIKHESVSGQYVCDLCTQHFNTRRNLTNHLDTHANRYTCRVCNKIVISKQNIMSHMYTEHDETNKQIKCDACHKTYKNRYTYAKHMRIHNSSKEYKCHLCPKVFLWKDNLNRHLTRHKSEKPFKCDQCSKSFFLKENLKDHLLVHSRAKRFYCVECDLSYASQVKLNQHLKRGTRHLRPEQLTFACKLCDKRYTNNLQLSMHNDRVHLNKRSQACHLCEAAFVSKKTLQTHIRAVHEGYRRPKVHICETCGKGFADKQVLKAHLRTHTGEKPYSCKYCGVKFAHSGAMYTHVKLVHLKIKKNKKRISSDDKITNTESSEVDGLLKHTK